MRRVLIATAVEAEQKAVLRGLLNSNKIDVLITGVGPVAAAVATTKAMAIKKYDLVISAGIAGGFPHKAGLSSLVVADEIIAADLGVQTPEGFRNLDTLGFGQTSFRSDPSLLHQTVTALTEEGLSPITGPVLTVSTVTGTSTTAQELITRIPEATAEAMEGFGVVSAAHAFGVPFLEIRSISNIVGPRNRENWRIKEALDTLSSASSALQKINFMMKQIEGITINYSPPTLTFRGESL